MPLSKYGSRTADPFKLSRSSYSNSTLRDISQLKSSSQKVVIIHPEHHLLSYSIPTPNNACPHMLVPKPFLWHTLFQRPFMSKLLSILLQALAFQATVLQQRQPQV